MENTPVILQELLFADKEKCAYAILDGAAIPDLLAMFDEYQPKHVCLFRGVEDPELAETAPYLVSLKRGSAFTEWLFAHGWGRHWGIFALVPAKVPFIALRRHFRGFVKARLPEGEAVYFRYYDPRVFNLYLPTCDSKELLAIFADVAWFYAEGKEEGKDCLVLYSLAKGELVVERKMLMKR